VILKITWDSWHTVRAAPAAAHEQLPGR
jgi:hypothetical protein